MPGALVDGTTPVPVGVAGVVAVDGQKPGPELPGAHFAARVLLSGWS